MCEEGAGVFGRFGLVPACRRGAGVLIKQKRPRRLGWDDKTGLSIFLKTGGGRLFFLNTEERNWTERNTRPSNVFYWAKNC
jgi:hypothetical protein